MLRSADVVIVGGGVVGASIAYHLTLEERLSVALLEREFLQGLGSTGRAAGGFRAQFAHPVDIRLSLYSLEVLRSFHEDTGVDPCYRPDGYLFLAANDEELQVLTAAVATQHEEGLAVSRIVDRDEIQERVPLLFCEDIAGASFCPVDGFIEPLEMMRGFTTRALDRGAHLLSGTEATSIKIEDGKVRGVVTNRGTIATGCVVNAAGAWAARIADMCGIELPVRPLRRQVAGTQPFVALPDGTPMVIEAGSGFHFRKDHWGGGVFLLWPDPDEPFGERQDVDAGWLATMHAMARRRLPCVEQMTISPRHCWAGSYAMTPDRHPVLGAAPGVEGLYLANGFSGHGVMHSPATGRILADLIRGGRTDLIDISLLAPERFAEGRAIEASRLL